MRKTKKVNRSTKRTRAAIRCALLDAMEQKPVTSITVQEVIDRANVCRTTFYAHYRDIYDLVQSVGDEIIEEVGEGLESIQNRADSTDFNRFETIEIVVKVYAKHADTIRMLNSANGDPAFDRRMQERICEITRNIRRKSDGPAFREDLHQMFSCYVISGGISVLNYLISNRLDWDPALAYELIGKMTVYADDLFLHQSANILPIHQPNLNVS